MRTLFKGTLVIMLNLCSMNYSMSAPESASAQPPAFEAPTKKSSLPSLNFIKRLGKSCTANCENPKICVKNGQNKDWLWCLENCTDKKDANGQKWDMKKLFNHYCGAKTNQTTQTPPVDANEQLLGQLQDSLKKGQFCGFYDTLSPENKTLVKGLSFSQQPQTPVEQTIKSLVTATQYRQQVMDCLLKDGVKLAGH